MSINKQPIIISVDGNIGSGKSSIIKYLQNNFEKFCNDNTSQNYKICFLQEPVAIWESIIDKNDGENIIQKFYNDNHKYAFAFQMMAYISRLKLLKDALSQDYDFIITERSILTDKNVFVTMLYKQNIINEIEYTIYNKWFDEFSNCIEKMKFVYIQTTPDICRNRILKRDRLGESIPITYLQNCHNEHEDWLTSPNLLEKGIILIINGNNETNINFNIFNKYFHDIMFQIFNFITN
tara:strand:+ start:5874 stop:6584 length:711 start_codon:yes stop_codon:yes gene_type:complete